MTTTATPDTAREEFMRLLTEHEDLVARLMVIEGSRARHLEAFRMSRRQVVACYDRATLTTSDLCPPHVCPTCYHMNDRCSHCDGSPR